MFFLIIIKNNQLLYIFYISPPEGQDSRSKFLCVGGTQDQIFIGDVTDRRYDVHCRGVKRSKSGITGTAWTNDGRNIITTSDEYFTIWKREWKISVGI